MVKDSYLNVERILEAAKTHLVDAIHPGYGLLSENADFARACTKADIVFIISRRLRLLSEWETRQVPAKLPNKQAYLLYQALMVSWTLSRLLNVSPKSWAIRS